MKPLTSAVDDPVVLGMDVHQDTISVCVFEPSTGAICDQRTIQNRPSRIKKYVRRVRRKFGEPHCCYEASSCGYVIYRQLREMDIKCAVIAPTSIPRRSGDRVKTDRIDAEKLATMFAGGLLTPIDVPDRAQESARALIRARQALVEDRTRAKHRTTKFLQTRGLVFRDGNNWTQKHWRWLRSLELDPIDQDVLDTHLAMVDYLDVQIRSLDEKLEEVARFPRYDRPVQILKAFRGIDTNTALTLSAELGDIRRFEHPRQLMSYVGVVPSEQSSGNRVKRGSITKAGNKHARKALVSAAWKYEHRPAVGVTLKKRQEGLPPPVIATSWKAQKRLHKRFHTLLYRRPRGVAAVAVARELCGFLWEALHHAVPESDTAEMPQAA